MTQINLDDGAPMHGTFSLIIVEIREELQILVPLDDIACKSLFRSLGGLDEFLRAANPVLSTTWFRTNKFRTIAQIYSGYSEGYPV